jgi:hypothetical protein
MTPRRARLVQIDGSMVGQLPPAIDHGQPAVVVTLDPRVRANADERSGQTLAQRSDLQVNAWMPPPYAAAVEDVEGIKLLLARDTEAVRALREVASN